MLRSNLEAGKTFLVKNRQKETVVTLPSGLQYEILTAGNGAKPKTTDKVKCHYHGTVLLTVLFSTVPFNADNRPYLV